MTRDLKNNEVWLLTGSQHLYGPDTLKKVAGHSRQIADWWNNTQNLSATFVWKPVVTTPEAISAVMDEANTHPECIAVITWMHTFSPAKMWVDGLCRLTKPWAHLHTQYHRDLPWASIDMDYMNLHQAAHGDREFGFMASRLRLRRKVVVGHWQDPRVTGEIDTFCRAAAGFAEFRRLKVARFGDNMREVSVTEGDKVEFQKVLGTRVNGYGVGDLVAMINGVPETEVKGLLSIYQKQYGAEAAGHPSVAQAARQELGLRAFLEKGGFGAFTTTFEDLHGLPQLPGLACQRLMADGFGFGAEGDWKTAALVRVMKVMGAGLPGGTSFMEDYTYHLDPVTPLVLGSHMLEVCPSIAASAPRLEVHPLGIGGKADPARLVFQTAPGAALNASLMDFGNRFRLLINTVDVVAAPAPTPALPVASVTWVPHPDLPRGAQGWILAGGAHHTGFSQNVTAAMLSDLAEMAGIECVTLGKDLDIGALKNTLRWNDLAYGLKVL